MRKLAVVLAAVLGLAAAASGQQPSPALGEMVIRALERPSDAALESFMAEQRTRSPGFVDRFDGAIGENLKIHSVVSRTTGGALDQSWIPDGKLVTVDIAAQLAKGGAARIKTATIHPHYSTVTPDHFGAGPPYAHASMSADVLRDHVVEADVLVTIDGRSVLLENVKLPSGQPTDVRAPNGDVFTLTATARDMTARERAPYELQQSESVMRTVKQRNDWDAANPGKPFQYPTGGGRRLTPEEIEIRRRPLSAEEDAFLSGAPSDVPDGYVVEASETLAFAGGEEIAALKGIGFDDLFQIDMERLPSGKKYASSTRYGASADGRIRVRKILLLDGAVLATPDLTVKSGESVRFAADGLDYKAVFTLRKMTANEKTAHFNYTMGNKRLPDPDTLPPGVDPRPKRPRGISRTMPSVAPLVSADGRPVSRLLARISDEEQDKQAKAEMEEFRANPPQGMSKAEVEDMLRNPPVPPKLQRARMVMFEYSNQLSQNFSSARTQPLSSLLKLPEGKLLETSMWVQLPGGEKLGPFRMYNSSAGRQDSLEAADGMFGSDGDERFVGTMLGTASADDTVEMTFMLVIDRQPVMVSGVRAKSGQAVAYTTEGGYRLIVRPVLRAPTWQEQRNIDQRRSAHIHQSIATRRSGPPEPPPEVSAPPVSVP